MPRFVLRKVRKFQDPSSNRLGDIKEKPEGWIKTTPLPLIGLNIDTAVFAATRSLKHVVWLFRCAAGDRADTATGRPYPVHTVAVERAVKVVTEAATAVVGEEQHHGFICSRPHHHKQLPTVSSKRSWSLMHKGRPQ